MKTIFLAFTLFLCLTAFAKDKTVSTKLKHREHGAHAHGAGTLGIAFEGLKGQLDFKIPSVSIIGFEYTPKTEKDKKIKLQQLAKLENNISEMVQFTPNLHCVITKDKVEVIKDEKESQEAHAEHSDITAIFNINCAQSPAGTELTFNFQKHFPDINDLDVQIIVGDIQKSIEAKKNGTRILIEK